MKKKKIRSYFSYIDELYKKKRITKKERDQIMNTFYSNRKKMSSHAGVIII